MFAASVLSIYLIPIAILIYFVASLISFCLAKHANKRSPGSYCEEDIKHRRTMLIVSSIFFALLFPVIISIVVLISSPVAFM